MLLTAIQDSKQAERQPFRCEVIPERDVVRVVPMGELDMATVEHVRSRIDEVVAAGFAHVLLDLRELLFMDSTGVRLILQRTAWASRDGGSFVLIAGPPAVQRVLEVSGVLELVRFRSS